MTNVHNAAKQDLPTTHSVQLPVATPNTHAAVNTGDAVKPAKPVTPGNSVKPMAARTGIADVNRVVKSVTDSLSSSKSLHPNKSGSAGDQKGALAG